MNRLTPNKSSYAKTASGSIDYQYYDNRARTLRSMSFFTMLRNIFTEKKTSCEKPHDDNTMQDQSDLDQDERQVDSMSEAA